jgi:hypothetical protein
MTFEPFCYAFEKIFCDDIPTIGARTTMMNTAKQ